MENPATMGTTGTPEETLLRQAALAPSSHNTQPWSFRTSNHRIDLYADRTRALPVNDPEDRELLISCGCALQNLLTAVAAMDLAATFKLLPDSKNPDLLATISLHGQAQAPAENADLAAYIDQRRTCRKRFAEQPVPQDILDRLSSAANREGVKLEIILDTAQRQAIAELVVAGDAVQWADPRWRRELAAWMHPRCQGDGLAVPGLVAPFVRAVVRTFNMGHGVGGRDRRLAEESPVLAVLVTERNDEKAWLETGQALQRLLLEATRNDLQASYLNQPIQVASLRSKLQNVLHTTGWPQILLRLGFSAEKLPASPRRSLNEILDRSVSR